MAMLKSCLLLFIIFSMVNTEVTRDAITRDVNGLDGLDGLDGCPAKWTQNRHRCFKYFSHPTKWITAERNCQSLGGNLASVRNKLDNDFLLSLVPPSTPTWVGAHDAVDGHWMWSDGTLFLYTHWCVGEPNKNPKGYQNCLEINHSSKRCWNDARCIHSLPYICVKNQRDHHAPQLL